MIFVDGMGIRNVCDSTEREIDVTIGAKIRGTYRVGTRDDIKINSGFY